MWNKKENLSKTIKNELDYPCIVCIYHKNAFRSNAEYGNYYYRIKHLKRKGGGMSVEKHLDLLGLEVKDKVTDFQGIVSSVCFDLFGCIQVDVRPKELNKDGKIQEGWWLDINRLEIVNEKPVIKKPNYNYGYISEGGKGASDKSPRK